MKNKRRGRRRRPPTPACVRPPRIRTPHHHLNSVMMNQNRHGLRVPGVCVPRRSFSFPASARDVRFEIAPLTELADSTRYCLSFFNFFIIFVDRGRGEQRILRSLTYRARAETEFGEAYGALGSYRILFKKVQLCKNDHEFEMRQQ